MALSADKKRLSIESDSGITPWEVAQCIGDYRTTKLGRDVGLLCCSPKVNRASLRRPFHIGRFVKAEEMESVMQSKDYGYEGVQTYSKLTTGSGTTKSFIDKIKGTTADSDLWLPSSPEQSDIPGLWQFDGYYHGARFIGADDELLGLEQRGGVVAGQTVGSFTLAAGTDAISTVVESDWMIIQCAILSKIKIRFTWSQSSYTGESVFKVSGDVTPMYYETAFGGDGEQHHININTTGHALNDTWTDTFGNTIELSADAGGKWYVDVYLSKLFFPAETTQNGYSLRYRISDFSNYSTRSGEYLPISATIASDGIANFVPSNTKTSSMGFYYKNHDDWYSEEWTTAKQGQPTPYAHFFTNRGITDHKPMLIVIASSRLTADETVIVNPWHEYSDVKFNGYVLYSNLGFSDNCLNSLTKVHVIKIYGSTAFIPNNVGYTAFSEADGYKLLCPPRAYSMMYDSSQS